MAATRWLDTAIETRPRPGPRRPAPPERRHDEADPPPPGRQARSPFLLASECAKGPGPTLSDRFLDERIIDPALAGARTPSAVAREILDEMPLAAFHGRIPGVRAVTDAVDFLISDRAAFITGAVLPVDGGKALG